MADQDVIDAIQDLTRVIVATSSRFENKSQAIRMLNDHGIPASRIGAILGIQTKDVSSLLTKDKKQKKSRSSASAKEG